MKTTVYVVAHSSRNCTTKKLPDIYKTLQVGACLSRDRFGDYQDDVGVNISQKNLNYCELTGLFWAWKNSADDIIGICHYRRFLLDTADHCLPSYYLDKDRIESILKLYDVILPKPYMEHQSIKDFYESGKANKKNELYELRKIVFKLYPDYMESFDSFFNGNEECRCNVMIMKRELFDEYCEWLFSILFELEKHINLSDYNQVDARIFGYLSERLLNVFVKNNNYKAYYCHMETVKNSIKYTIKCLLDRIGWLKYVRKIALFSTNQ